MVSQKPQARRMRDIAVGGLQHSIDKATQESILASGMRPRKRDTAVALRLEMNAVTRRRIVGSLLGAAVAVGVMAPAFGALDPAARGISFDTKAPAIASFTPASADPKLAALLARTGIGKSAYRFTPSETARVGSRAVTVAVRVQAPLSSIGTGDSIDPIVPTVQVAPIAYNLGASVGWKRFASSGDMAGLDLAGLGNRDRLDIAKRPSTRAADHPAGPSRLVVDDNVIDAGSFSLSRHIDLTAGSRKSDNNRLERLSDNRRDSQAVYIGTAIRF